MTRRIFMYSSIDSVTEMTSGNLVHGSCIVTHGSGNGGNVNRLRVVPHFSSGIVKRANRERA